MGIVAIIKIRLLFLHGLTCLVVVVIKTIIGGIDMEEGA